MEEIREFILTKTGEINEKLDKKLEVVPCETTLTQVTCLLMLSIMHNALSFNSLDRIQYWFT
jgi:hypothetical protein